MVPLWGQMSTFGGVTKGPEAGTFSVELGPNLGRRDLSLENKKLFSVVLENPFQGTPHQNGTLTPLGVEF